MRKDLVLVIIILIAFPIYSNAQGTAIELQKAQDGKIVNHYVVAAANHDPLAITPKQIFSANQILAKTGSTDAAWELGLAYMQGFGVEQNLALAEHWFEIGATDPDEKNIVGEMYANGEYFPRNVDAAARWFTSAGRPLDFFELAQAYRNASPPQLGKAMAIYLALLKDAGHPEVRRAQLELGRLVLDGKYSAGDDAKGRALNMERARFYVQEMLGNEEYSIAVDYFVGEYVPKSQAIWLRFCKRAAAYDVDLAQEHYAGAIMNAQAPNFSGYDDVAWTRLASQKQSGELVALRAMVSPMTPKQRAAADAAYQTLVQTRIRNGAYYPKDDPLRNPSAAALAAMPQDDPDVQLRRAFNLEKSAQNDGAIYEKVMDTYHTIYQRREMDIRFVLGRNLVNGTDGFPKDEESGEDWIREAAKRGSKPAQNLLAGLDKSDNK